MEITFGEVVIPSQIRSIHSMGPDEKGKNENSSRNPFSNQVNSLS